MSSPPYFKQNKFLQWLGNVAAPPVTDRKPKYKGESTNPLRELYLDFIGDILPQLFNVGGRPSGSVNRQGNLMSLLDTLKNLFIGKIRLPHAHMINHGIQSITFEAVFSQQVQKMEKKGDGYAAESQRIPRLMAALEKLVRVFDQLDEQLHAGFYFYLMIGVSRFISNNEFVYPAAMIFFGFFIPNLFDFYDSFESTNTKEKEENNDEDEAAGGGSIDPTLGFVGILYFLCLIFLILPTGLFLIQKHMTGLKEDSICYLPRSQRDAFFDQIVMCMLFCLLAFLTYYNFCRPRRRPLNIVLIKSYNLFITCTLTASICFFHYPAALINLVFIFPLLHNAIGLLNRQLSKTLQLSTRQIISSHIFFFIWLFLSVATLFGTVLLRDKDVAHGLQTIYRNMF